MQALGIAILVAVSIGSTALAQQQRGARDMMNDLKAKHGETFEFCRDLAVARGFRLDEETVDHSVMMFIEGCIMGRQR